jgi:hypothetical protein
MNSVRPAPLVRIPNQDVRHRLIEREPALARGDDAIDRAAAGPRDVFPAGPNERGRDAPIAHPRHAGAAHFHDGIGKRIADRTRPLQHDARANTGERVAERGKTSSARGDAARVELHANPLRRISFRSRGQRFEILAREGVHAAAFRCLDRRDQPATSAGLTWPCVWPSTTMAGAMPQQPMQRTVSRWNWRSAVVWPSAIPSSARHWLEHCPSLQVTRGPVADGERVRPGGCSLK